MEALYSTSIPTGYGEKTISVYTCNILDFDERIDILTLSAFLRDYYPSRSSLIGALDKVGISVKELSRCPTIDLRSMCNIWLSRKIHTSRHNIGRIGCIELAPYGYDDLNSEEDAMLHSIKAFFQMLDIAATYDIKMDTIALPLLGAGNQRISTKLTLIPILNECVAFLKRNASVKRIYFIERNSQKSTLIKHALENSYSICHEITLSSQNAKPAVSPCPIAFISYSSPDKNIADNLCSKLEHKGIRVWYAPRDVHGPYASAIAEAIERADYFIIILSKNSIYSQHVLNEIDLAFQKLPDNIKFRPLRIDEALFTPSFNYYLSRQHWMDAHIPPLEQRLEEFVRHIVTEL